MERRIVTRGKRGEVVRVVEYYEPHVAEERRLKRRMRGIGLVLCVGILAGFILSQLYIEARNELRRPVYSQY